MKKRLTGAAMLVVGLVLGSVTTAVLGIADDPKPAFIVVGSASLEAADAEALAAYSEAAGPLARAAGLEMMARGFPTVLEGEWPSGVRIAVERFPSMAALEGFWFSDGYQAAKKFREGQSDVRFIVAIEGT